MVPVEKVKVDTVRHLLDTDCLCVSLVLENELFQQVECSLVVHLLAALNYCAPCVVGCNHVTVGALKIVDHELHHEDLLQNHAAINLLLNGQLYLHTRQAVGERMWLSMPICKLV